MGVLHFYFIQNGIDLIGNCLKIVLCPTYVKTETGTLLLISQSPCYQELSFFATPWHWQPLVCTGTIITAVPNPSMKTSSICLRQRHLHAVGGQVIVLIVPFPPKYVM
jgi:hypothetical protein